VRFESVRALMRALVKRSPEEQRRIIWSMTPADVLALDADFESWAHQAQLPPGQEGWRTWLMLAGRGFGKTRAGAEWVDALARSRPGVRIALVGATIDEARRVMVEGVSGVLVVAARRRHRVKWEPSLGRLTWPNGSEAQLFSGDNPDGLRGPEHDFAWCDELAKWREAEAAWMNLQMGLRRGRRPRALVTTTPRPIDLLKRIRDEQWTVTTTGRTDDNVNLDEKFVEVMVATYGANPAGEWAQHADHLAGFTSGGWRFVAPAAGLSVLVKTSGVFATWGASGWEVGTVSASRLVVEGLQVVGTRQDAIPDPAGGATVDAEARAALEQVLVALRTHGLIASQ